jgi:hypothetical protein
LSFFSEPPREPCPPAANERIVIGQWGSSGLKPWDVGDRRAVTGLVVENWEIDEANSCDGRTLVDSKPQPRQSLTSPRSSRFLRW